MLFNSYEFLFFFLPVTIAVFFAFSGFRQVRAAAAWLALVSIFFYGYWSPRYVILLMGSILLNFAAGHAILRFRSANKLTLARRILTLAIVTNLSALAYFKYANFFVDSINSALSSHIAIARIVLPIGISFFTFTQIAYLVDTFSGKVKETRFVPYTLFVTFFPHLIAGPVLHHAEMMPQFARDETYRFNLQNFLIGVAFFAIGLFKKVILADGIQPFVGPVFEADPGYALTAIEAWGGVLAYTLQLYFDFSGYSDMAIGLSKMLNVDLPLNFNSPYKAINISDFWRRWHMTLSRFLRDYLYIPLGGNRKGPVLRYANLLTTMLLGGLWHGAGWTFVIWGGLHGLYLVVHQLWQAARERFLGHDLTKPSFFSRLLSGLLTFVCVVVAWVFFRATNLDSATNVLKGMVGLNGLSIPTEWQSLFGAGASRSLDAFGGMRQTVWIALLLAIVWLVPNSQELIGRARSGKLAAVFAKEHWAWMSLGSFAVVLFLLAAINGSRGSSEFIYFNF
jgi:alginate O-acetyltransferase complex protein AlgI